MANYDNNTGQSIGGGVSIPLPSALEKAGLTDKQWAGFVTGVITPFYREHHRLPTLTEMNSAVAAAR